MKILVIHEYNFPHGGGERYLHDTCQVLRDKGHRVALVCARDRNEGFLPVDACYGIERSIGLRSGRRVLPSVEAILQREQTDLVFINGIGRLFLSPFILQRVVRSLPSIFFVHHLDIVCPTGRKVVPSNNQPCEWAMGASCFRKGCIRTTNGSAINKLRSMGISLWRRHAARNCGRVIVPSRYVQRECIRNGFPPNQLRVLPYFTTKGRGPVSDPRAPTLLWVGRVETGKGLDHFLVSLSGLKDLAWQAVMVGDGPSRDEAIDLTARLGLSHRVTFVGKLGSDELDAFYASSRLLVMTSTWAETFGQVGIEAMAFGRPVVAYDAGGPTEWLVDRLTGYLVRRGDSSGMADRIASLLQDDHQWRRMSKKAKEYVDQRFRPEHHIPRLVQVFEEAIRVYRGEAVESAGGV